MEERHDISAFEPEELTYRGVDVKLELPRSIKDETAKITIGDRTYEARRHEHAGAMWTAPGVFNMFTSLGELARHMIDLDLQGILAPPTPRKRTTHSRKR